MNGKERATVEFDAEFFDSVKIAENHTVSETLQYVENTIAEAEGLELEYYEIVDGNTLQKITDWAETDYVVGCITVYCGDVRLIDNIKYKERI